MEFSDGYTFSDHQNRCPPAYLPLGPIRRMPFKQAEYTLKYKTQPLSTPFSQGSSVDKASIGNIEKPHSLFALVQKDSN